MHYHFMYFLIKSGTRDLTLGFKAGHDADKRGTNIRPGIEYDTQHTCSTNQGICWKVDKIDRDGGAVDR